MTSEKQNSHCSTGKRAQHLWSPRYGECYFFVDIDGVVASTLWFKDDTDLQRLKAGNVFRDGKTAQAYANVYKEENND